MINSVKYSGNEQVIDGNGDKLQIVSVENSYLSVGTTGLNLKNMLYVPTIKKIIIYTSNFTVIIAWLRTGIRVKFYWKEHLMMVFTIVGELH